MLLLAQIQGTTILFLAGLVLTCSVLLLRTHRQLSKRPRTEMPSPASFSHPRLQSAAGHHLDAPRDVRQWEVEMHDLARELRGELDSKIAILERLIQDAKQQADRLEAAIGSAEDVRIAGADQTHAPARPENGQPSSTRVDGIHRAASPASRRHTEIYSLADQGLSSAAIATRLSSPIGEVELILGLRGKV
jgi:hypothetical protein